MATREIPSAYEITCDGCKAGIVKASNHRPDHWSDLHVLRDAYDFQGAACADASVKLLLCTDCTTTVVTAINAAIDKRRASLAPKDHPHDR